MAEPSRARRQLGAELRALRTLAGDTQRQLADKSGIGQVSISRIERGEQRPTRSQVEKWLETYEPADDDTLRRIVTLATIAHNETVAWPEVDDVAGHLQGVARDREATATTVRNCQLTLIPGLMQTAEYARLLIPQMDPAGSIDHAAAVAGRVQRQQILYSPGRRFEFLIGEQALLWEPGPGVMPAQLDRLLTLATLEWVEVRVLPLRRVGHPAWHSFVLFTTSDAEVGTYVTTELLHGGQNLRDPDVVQMYERLWKALWSDAASGDKAADMIRSTRAVR